ncbi:hypothetical protein DVH24_005055 [Malus domestica]|uniref:1-acylglycerol-3-phosphate O-acyltransferase n=1 Tax=Malus domestica TaxID=3750 RepID=A0A498II19_MALDO|nr:hypothetical protein DVH24_005055 [Malus domestica]
MAIAAAAVIVPLGLLFFVSGLVVNLIQAICFILIRPLSKNTYRKINRVVAELLWLELVWLIDWWAGVKIQVYTDPETFRLMGKEHALVICNHRSDIDWLVGWVLAQRSGCLGSTLAVMKKSSKFLPLGLQRLKDYPQPFWLALFVEGTRFTQAKLLAAQEYAASTGLPVPRNVLIPRTKGFVSAVSHMRSFVPAIYDVTVAIPKASPSPTMLRLFQGRPSVVHVQIKRHLMKELPETDEAVAQWCKDIFVAKVVASWSCLLILGALKFLYRSSLLSSWKGIGFSTLGLSIVTVLMQFLIRFSQSERSTPARVAPAKDNSKGESSSNLDKQQ